MNQATEHFDPLKARMKEISLAEAVYNSGLTSYGGDSVDIQVQYPLYSLRLAFPEQVKRLPKSMRQLYKHASHLNSSEGLKYAVSFTSHCICLCAILVSL